MGIIPHLGAKNNRFLPCCGCCFAYMYAWISQVAHSGEELMPHELRVYKMHHLFIFFCFFLFLRLLIPLLLFSASWGRLPFWQERLAAFFGRRGRLPFWPDFFRMVTILRACAWEGCSGGDFFRRFFFVWSVYILFPLPLLLV